MKLCKSHFHFLIACDRIMRRLMLLFFLDARASRETSNRKEMPLDDLIQIGLDRKHKEDSSIFKNIFHYAS